MRLSGVLSALLLVAFLSSAAAAGCNYQNPCGFPQQVPFGREDGTYDCVAMPAAYDEALLYLKKNMPSFDRINAGSLGLGNSEESSVGYGLNIGVANYGANLTLSTKSTYPWAAALPKELFMEYVLPYGNVNEARTNWRPLFEEATRSILSPYCAEYEVLTVSQVVQLINSELWSAGAFGAGSNSIVFQSDSTPLIYDPMSMLAFGYASCTGVSIFFVDALRAAGIAARVAGTPAWNGDINNGNHNWLEVWNPDCTTTTTIAASTHASHATKTPATTGCWQFIEGAPAGAGETLENPCDKWFCSPGKFANGTQVFAARFDQRAAVRYPLAWDLSNDAIPGEDVTDYYQHLCNKC